MSISSRHCSSNFAHSFDFHCLNNFGKNINLSEMFSLWCELLCKHSIYTLKSDQWIKIWRVKFELECLILIFIYSNSKFKVTSKNADFECRRIRTHTEEKPSKISNIKFAILPYSYKNTSTKLPSEYFGVYFSWWNHQMRSKMVHFNTKNAKSRVRQSQMCYLRTTHSHIFSDNPWQLSSWIIIQVKKIRLEDKDMNWNVLFL